MSIKRFISKFNFYYTNMNNTSLKRGIIHKIFLFIDYIFTFIVEGCSLTNYFVYGFHNMRHSEKIKFVTWRRQKWIYSKCNDESYIHLLRDKDEINRIFSEYLGRNYIIVDQATYKEVEEFIEINPVFIAKPVHGTEGQNIYKYHHLDENGKREMYDYLQGQDYMLETYIVQHPVINELHPSSVNTIRITTIRNKDGVNVMSASLRMGRHGAVNDNYTTGGIVAAIDLDTGIVKTQGVDKMNYRYVLHPETNKQIVGLHVPYWDEAVNLVKKIGTVVQQVRYTGWDIAITESGPVLVEGNYQGNFHIQQHSDMEGKYELYKKTIARI